MKRKYKLLKFKCPECQGIHALDEVVVDATVYNEVKGVEEDEEWPEYGVCGTIEGGTIYAYQCAGCGYRLPEITTPEELVDYLKNHGVIRDKTKRK